MIGLQTLAFANNMHHHHGIKAFVNRCEFSADLIVFHPKKYMPVLTFDIPYAHLFFLHQCQFPLL